MASTIPSANPAAAPAASDAEVDTRRALFLIIRGVAERIFGPLTSLPGAQELLSEQLELLMLAISVSTEEGVEGVTERALRVVEMKKKVSEEAEERSRRRDVVVDLTTEDEDEETAEAPAEGQTPDTATEQKIKRDVLASLSEFDKVVAAIMGGNVDLA